MIDWTGVKANWASPVVEQLSFNTLVRTSRDLTEQREALRSKPLTVLSLQANLVASGQSAQLMILRSVGEQLSMADFSKQMDVRSRSGVTLSVPGGVPVCIIPGTVLLAATFSGALLSLVVSSATEFEVVVASIPPDTPTAFKMWPKKLWFMGDTVSLTNPTAGSGSVDLSLRILDPYKGLGGYPREFAASYIHDRTGLEIMADKPDWSGGVSHSSTRQGRVLDNNYGVLEYKAATSFPLLGMSSTHRVASVRDADNWRCFFHRCRGSQRSFIQPSRMQELVMLPADVGFDFKVSGTELLGWVDLISASLFIYLEYADGAVSVHEITEVAAASGNTSVKTAGDPFTLPGKTPWGARLACLAFRARLSSDILSISHQTNTIGSVDLETIMVRS